MLFLFRGPYRIAAKVVIGVALVVVGVVDHATIVTVIGAGALVWGLYDAIRGRGSGNGA